ncbi:MAG TPA: ATP synthase subunit I [Burkholderiales bacterium]|jgi:ATP synthase protein I
MAGSTTSDGIGRQVRQLNAALAPSRPVRVVLRWQLIATLGFSLAAAYAAGTHGALSAVLGGAVSVISGLTFTAITASRKLRSADGILAAALRAEGAKIVCIIVLLWLVLSWYSQVVTVAFFLTFAATLIISSLAFFVREK